MLRREGHLNARHATQCATPGPQAIFTQLISFLPGGRSGSLLHRFLHEGLLAAKSNMILPRTRVTCQAKDCSPLGESIRGTTTPRALTALGTELSGTRYALIVLSNDLGEGRSPRCAWQRAVWWGNTTQRPY